MATKIICDFCKREAKGDIRFTVRQEFNSPPYLTDHDMCKACFERLDVPEKK